MVVQKLAKIQRRPFQRRPFQRLKRINPKNMAMSCFQMDMLMIHDNVFDAIEQQFDSSFFLWVRHDV